MINTTTLLGEVFAGLVTLFGGELTVGLWLLVFLLGVGSMFQIAFSMILLAMLPVTVVLMANGWVAGAVGFPLILFIAVVLAFSFFQHRK